ncbi:NADP-dependent malic enzyme [Candidatus Nasuia deltocephalinicola]|nr:NADP-dependent malic enzyme [Candidatus Nasuia deltocephalinicola]
MNNIKYKIIFYHNKPFFGKFYIDTNKLIINNNYLSLCYTPGVGYISKLIYKDFYNIYKYTIKSNLVAVLSNGTAVLGLGFLGPLASKSVMEGKSILFKKFADINSFDLEIFELNSNNLIHIISSLEVTFGGINLEDIKSPECFFIENNLKSISSIPVFHDDQHGTAICVSSAILNSLKFLKKNIFNIKIVVLGAGAASLSSLNLLINLGFVKKNIFVFDSLGLLSKDRNNINIYKKNFINLENFLLLKDFNLNFDLILGCSKPNSVNNKLLNFMFYNSIILFLSNPDPEILPEIVKFKRFDSIVFTGRSDYNNQVNNLLCFPFIFRGILDSLSKDINFFIKKKCVFVLSNLVFINFLEKKFFFKNFILKKISKEYIIVSPFDKRLIVRIPFIIYKNSVKFGWCNKYNKNFFFYLKKLSLINLK